jgi:hypothetical protein
MYSGYQGSFPRGKARPGRDADHPPHLVPRSKMSRSCTSSPRCASTGALWDCFTFYLLSYAINKRLLYIEEYTALVSSLRSLVISAEQFKRWFDLPGLLLSVRSRVSSGSIVSDYGLDDPAIEVRSPAEAKEFFL